jgi:hypothetical protein
MSRWSFPLLLAAAFLCSPACAGSALPTVATVEARFVQALGGAAAIVRPHSMTTSGFIVAYGASGKRTRIPFVVYAANFERLEIHTVPGKGTFSFGYDGRTAWSLAPGAKAQVFTGTDAETVRRDADLYYFSRVPTYFRSMKVVGEEAFYGHRCYRVRGVNLWGNVNNHYYDVRSGLLVGYRFHQWTHGAPERAESVQVFDDYRRFDGLLISMHETDYRDGRLIGVVRYTSIRMNDVDPKTFELPPAVAKLRKNTV